MKISKKISILFLLDEKKKPISFTLNSSVAKVFVLIFLTFLFTSIVFLGLYSKILYKNYSILNLEKENIRLKNENALRDQYLETQKEILYTQNKIKNILGTNVLIDNNSNDNNYFSTKTNDQSTISTKDVDDFVRKIRLKQNLNFLENKNDLKKQEELFEAIPNVLPVEGWITRGYDTVSNTAKPLHLGIDIAAPINTPIKSTAPGIVISAGWKNDLGNFLAIDHGFGFVTKYGHCSRLKAKKGDIVKKGEIVAFLGNTGRSSAPHVHYELVKNGLQEDPILFLIK